MNFENFIVKFLFKAKFAQPRLEISTLKIFRLYGIAIYTHMILVSFVSWWAGYNTLYVKCIYIMYKITMVFQLYILALMCLELIMHVPKV